MKAILKSTAVMTALLVTVSATAAPSNGAKLSECKQAITAEFNDVQRIKLATMKDRRGTLTAKYRVSADGERATFTCTFADDASPLLVRTDKAVQQVAGGE
jgi:hypothetical protein